MQPTDARHAAGRLYDQQAHERQTLHLVEHILARQADEARPVIINLASQEYFRAARRAVLRARVVDCVFEDWKDGRYKVISFFAKRARGLMARRQP